MRTVILALACVIVNLPSSALAAPEIADADLRASMAALSAATLAGGEGWTAYERFLHPEYTRWAMGEVYEGRDKFVKSLEQWWDYGMRVAEREIEIIAVDQVGDLAIVRFKTTESFVGPDGPVDGFTGYVSNFWVREAGKWTLLSAEISSAAHTD